MRIVTLDDWFRERTDIPQWLAGEVGRIAVEWSYLNTSLKKLYAF